MIKIRKFVTIEKEIEVEVTAGDIIELLDGLKPDESQRALLETINTAGRIFNAIGDRRIGTLEPAQRKLISKFLAEQSKRFDFLDSGPKDVTI